MFKYCVPMKDKKTISRVHVCAVHKQASTLAGFIRSEARFNLVVVRFANAVIIYETMKAIKKIQNARHLRQLNRGFSLAVKSVHIS